jgi:hypothetical protein
MFTYIWHYAEKRFVIPDLLTPILGNSKVPVSLNLSQNAYTIIGLAWQKPFLHFALQNA